jgi:hypothetical protein
VLLDVGRFMFLFSRPRVALATENLFLRKQLALFQERKVRPPRAEDSTRWVVATLTRVFQRRDAPANVKPDTLIGWHRRGFRWDSIFSKELDQAVTDLGVRILRTPMRAPDGNCASSVSELFDPVW